MNPFLNPFPSDLPLDLTPYLVEAEVQQIHHTVSCQTDAFSDKVLMKTYIPAKTGIDAGTQIELSDGLFDFDVEVDPIVQVLAWKTIEQAIMEIREEQELRHLASRQETLLTDVRFENDTHAQLLRHAQEAQKFKREAKSRARAQLRDIRQVEEKLLAQSLGQKLLGNIRAQVDASLEKEGVFYHVVEKQIELEFLPWLYAEAKNSMDNLGTIQNLMQELVDSPVLSQADRLWRKSQVQSQLRIDVKGRGWGIDCIGPIPVSGEETQAEMEHLIQVRIASSIDIDLMSTMINE